jgi:uncharacterized membrane protein
MSKIKGFTARKIVITGVLGAISAVLGLTPLGFIPVGVTRATIMHIPVIIGAITEGPTVGGLVGLIFGLFSIFQAIANPTPVSFVFFESNYIGSAKNSYRNHFLLYLYRI